MKNMLKILFVMTLLLAFHSSAHALSSYLTNFNNTYGTSATALNTCSLCHTSVPSLNPYGSAFSVGHNFQAIESADSDGDTFTNIAEINARTFPGDPNSKPAPTPPQACTYTYSAWGACQSNGTQTRTVISSSPAGCVGTPVTSQSCTYVPPTPPPTPTPTPTPTPSPTPMPTTQAPTGQMNFSYHPTATPVVNPDPSLAMPIGVGPVATGGNTISIKVETANFSAPVDVYLGVFAPTYTDLFDPMNVYLMGSAFGWKPVSGDKKLERWKKNVTSVNESLFGDIPVSELTPGPYVLLMGVIPSNGHDNDDDDDDDDGVDLHNAAKKNYYFWVTYFIVQ